MGVNLARMGSEGAEGCWGMKESDTQTIARDGGSRMAFGMPKEAKQALSMTFPSCSDF
ncbi:MAG TPA: chemotaxis protein CheB [Thermodesulfobacteriota bacterium]|nr:chemotaxis protein CheB [Thermodesulfobacteriota bacterium]